MKRKWKIYVGILFLIIVLGGIFVLSHFQKKTEIVWYLTDPEYYGVEREELIPYQEVYAKRFELFNKRLGELGIPAKVIFKYSPDEYEASAEEIEDGSWYPKQVEISGTKIRKLLQTDSKADIIEFSPIEYMEFLPLDEYFKEEKIKQVKEAFPDPIWEVNGINERTYQIPRGNVCVKETVYSFYKPFLEENQIELDEETIRQMTPEEVIDWLLPYFGKEDNLEDKYYLTSAQDLYYENYFSGKHIPLLTGTEDNLVLDLGQKQVMDTFSMKEMLEGMELYQRIYKEGIDEHENPRSIFAMPVFRIGSIPSIEELQGSEKTEELWREVPFNNTHLTASIGNGVLKSSKNPEMAMQILAASAYDEELSNIMIYGVPEEDYRLEDGHAVYTEPKAATFMGTFSAVGNNLIAYPNELEVLDKKEKTIKIIENTPVIPYSNFVPEWEEGLFEKMVKIADIYQETVSAVEASEVSDLEKYLAGQGEKLKEAGLEEVIAELQKQVDSWEE